MLWPAEQRGSTWYLTKMECAQHVKYKILWGSQNHPKFLIVNGNSNDLE